MRLGSCRKSRRVARARSRAGEPRSADMLGANKSGDAAARVAFCSFGQKESKCLFSSEVPMLKPTLEHAKHFTCKPYRPSVNDGT